MKNEPFVIERTYNAPVARVWKAITDKDQMKEWYFDLPEFKAEKDFEFQFTAEDADCHKYVHLCKILEVIPQKKLQHSWRYEGFDGDSTVTIELFDEGEKTRLKLTHEGLESFPSLPEFAKESFAQGWTEIMGTALPEFVEVDTIHKKVDINAAPDRIWEVLTLPEYTPEWANAFYEGTTVSSTWQEGDTITWKMPDGSTAAKGIISESHPGVRLKADYYDNVNDGPPSATGEYSEVYEIELGTDQCIFKISSGPLAKKYLSLHEPLWNKALQNIKTLSEQ